MPDRREGIDKRLSNLLTGLSIIFVILGISLWFFQVSRTDTYAALAYNNRLRMLRLPADRGEIYDRNGAPLAKDINTFSIMGYPLDIRKNDLVPVIVKVFNDHGLPLSRDQIERSIKGQYLVPYRAVTIVKDLTLSQMTDIISDPRFPSLLFPMKVSRRTYPAGPLVSHLLGYVAEINREELADMEGDYRGGDMIGKAGVEKNFEDVLKGKPGKQAIEVDARGRKVRTLNFTPSRSGKDIKLSIDLGSQLLVANRFGDFKGAAVAIDVFSGEILTLFSSPGYDNNPLTRGISSEEWRLISLDKERPLMNRCISGLYPPGSTFKPVIALAGLEKGTINSRTTFYCNGAMRLGDRTFRCWKRSGHGRVDLAEAIKESCDVYFYNVGLKTGIDDLSKMASIFGVGKITGIPLPSERSGNVIDRQWKRKNIGERWYSGDTVNYSIGQGYLLMTPLQIARMYASFANGGKMIAPRLTPAVINEVPEGGTTDISKAHFELIREALRQVVKDGTAKQAGQYGVSVAGKTGSCQNPHGPDHALFAGYAPADDPRYAVALVLEAGEHGGSVASPIAGELLAYLVKHNGE